jgi:adenylate cyclase
MEAENEISHTQTRTREAFNEYLTEIINYPERRHEIVASIESVFGESKAILVLDMSGFSRTTQQQGILSFLLMIHQMQLISRPAIEQAGGKVIKGEADNLFCLFDRVAEAVAAGKEIINRLTTVNMILPVERRL